MTKVGKDEGEKGAVKGRRENNEGGSTGGCFCHHKLRNLHK